MCVPQFSSARLLVLFSRCPAPLSAETNKTPRSPLTPKNQTEVSSRQNRAHRSGTHNDPSSKVAAHTFPCPEPFLCRVALQQREENITAALGRQTPFRVPSSNVCGGVPGSGLRLYARRLQHLLQFPTAVELEGLCNHMANICFNFPLPSSLRVSATTWSSPEPLLPLPHQSVLALNHSGPWSNHTPLCQKARNRTDQAAALALPLLQEKRCISSMQEEESACSWGAQRVNRKRAMWRSAVRRG